MDSLLLITCVLSEVYARLRCSNNDLAFSPSQYPTMQYITVFLFLWVLPVSSGHRITLCQLLLRKILQITKTKQ